MVAGSAPPGTEPDLLLGPLLRYVDQGAATVWVETDQRCEVTVALTGGPSTTVPTWSVHGHHYALVIIEGLEPDTLYPYAVHLDRCRVWPPAGSPETVPSVIHTYADDEQVRLAFGSCRRVAPFDKTGLRTFGADALVALSAQVSESDPSTWPDLLLLAGDQIYADDPSAKALEQLRERYGPDDEIREEVHNFEEYTWLYRNSWTVPAVRWLLASIPSAMILDDHDLRDDWNTSFAWRQQMQSKPWWQDRVVGAFTSYWIYQHIGNLSPAELRANDVFTQVTTIADDDERTRLIEEMAWRADHHPESARWSFVRDLGRTRLVVIDTRASRSLLPDQRAIVDSVEWDWLVHKCSEPVDHLLIGTTLPFLMIPSLHHLEGWNEATAKGAWGRAYRFVAEHIRQLVDLEHWAAFRTSFDDLTALLTDVASSDTPPASIQILSGDLHCSYHAEAKLTEASASPTRVHQLVMSPFRNPLSRSIRLVNRVAGRRITEWITHELARHTGVTDPEITWSIDRGPYFDNGVMTVETVGRWARVRLETAYASGSEQRLQTRGHIMLAKG